jgi:hypothetical protein
MPCRHFYTCKGCGEELKPLPGDCCVFLFLRHGAVAAGPDRAMLLVAAEMVVIGFGILRLLQ